MDLDLKAERDTVFFSQGFRDKNNPTADELRERCKMSAPAGFSEHATGYAVDINSLVESFKDSDAYKWLQTNAQSYGWELSFPNSQTQVAFEPWHWKFVGNSKFPIQ